jgi:hypothetical protein
MTQKIDLRREDMRKHSAESMRRVNQRLQDVGVDRVGEFAALFSHTCKSLGNAKALLLTTTMEPKLQHAFCMAALGAMISFIEADAIQNNGDDKDELKLGGSAP